MRFFPAVGIHVFHTGEVARFPHVSSRLITSRDEAQWWGASFGTRRSLVRFQSSRPTGTRGSPRAPACPGRSSSVSRAAEYPRHPLCPAPGRPARVTVNQQDAGANPVCDSEIRTKEREQAPRERDIILDQEQFHGIGPSREGVPVEVSLRILKVTGLNVFRE